MSHRIAVIGFGAISRAVVARLQAEGDSCWIIAVLRRTESQQSLPAGVLSVESLAALRAFTPDLVVEAAGHSAVREFAPTLLQAGIPVLITSVGALHDAALLCACEEAARASGVRLIIPSGALAGVDYVRAARGLKGLKLHYESRKGVAAWRQELTELGHDPDTLDHPVTLMHGNAREAAARYPASLNVAATLALAGDGFEAIDARVIADPALTGNRHSITIESEAGRMESVIDNRASAENPRSSAIVAPAICAAIRQFFSPIQML